MVTHEHDLVRMFHRRVIETSDGCVVSDSGPVSPEGEAAGNAGSEGAGAAMTVDDVLNDVGRTHGSRKGGRYEIQ